MLRQEAALNRILRVRHCRFALLCCLLSLCCGPVLLSCDTIIVGRPGCGVLDRQTGTESGQETESVGKEGYQLEGKEVE